MSSKTTIPMSGRVPKEVKETRDNALKYGNSTMRDILTDIADKLRSGEISFQDERVILPCANELEYDLDNLIDACENKGVKVQDAINKAAQMVWRS